MAAPMTYDQLKAALVAEGLTVKEVPGSRDRCRCHTGSHAKGGPTIRAWGSMNGVMVHITAGNLGGRTPLQYIASIINGDPELPDKVQLVTDPDGVVYINSGGRSNHAGEISQSSLDHSIAADWPLDKWTDHRGTGVDGNAHFYGIENIAASAMTAAQRKTTVSICAAIARHHGWTGRETVGHGECSSARGYADPALNTGTLRKDVMAQVKSKPGTKPPTPTPPPGYVDVAVSYQNVAGYNAPGQPGVTGFRTHIPNIAKAVIADKADIFAGVEISNKLTARMRPLLDGSLKGHLTRAPGGTDGRYLYNGTDIKVIASGSFTAAKSTWYAGDDKQAAWEVYEKDGARGAIMTYQLAFQDGAVPDKKRVAQALDFLGQFTRVVAAHEVLPENAVIIGDTNSLQLVSAAMDAHGWRAFSVDDPTFNNWGHGAGTSIDHAYRLQAAKAGSYKVIESKDSDHNRIRFVFSLRKA